MLATKVLVTKVSIIPVISHISGNLKTEFYQELTVTMVQVPKGTAVSTQGQH